MYNVSQTIKSVSFCQFFFCFTDSCGDSEAEPRSFVYLYVNHLSQLEIFGQPLFCSAMLMWLLSNKIASSACRNGLTSRVWSIRSRSSTFSRIFHKRLLALYFLIRHNGAVHVWQPRRLQIFSVRHRGKQRFQCPFRP